jgi:hypothetical protein
VLRCTVAVLQFQNRLCESQKLTLYLYINIEVFLGYGKAFRELQHCSAAAELEKYFENFLSFIREPQCGCCIFAVSKQGGECTP